MAAQFKVTASSLNLRARADPGSASLAVIPGGGVVTEAAVSATPGWRNVSWTDAAGSTLTGFAASQYLEAYAPDDPGPKVLFGAAPPLSARDTDTGKLHPTVRAAVAATLQTLTSEGIGFAVFEAFRPPERQTWLYAQGRSRPGGIVTRSQAWQSYHQYGLAVDLVLHENGTWSWDSSGGNAAKWSRMHAVARANGLRSLDFEAPHVEFAGPDWRTLQQNQGWPTGGDDAWFDTVAAAAARWRAGQGAPAGPALTPAERPALSQQGSPDA